MLEASHRESPGVDICQRNLPKEEKPEKSGDGQKEGILWEVVLAAIKGKVAVHSTSESKKSWLRIQWDCFLISWLHSSVCSLPYLASSSQREWLTYVSCLKVPEKRMAHGMVKRDWYEHLPRILIRCGRGSSVVRSTCLIWFGPRFGSRHSHDSSQPISL